MNTRFYKLANPWLLGLTAWALVVSPLPRTPFSSRAQLSEPQRDADADPSRNDSPILGQLPRSHAQASLSLAGGSATTLAAAALSRADLAMIRATINPTQFSGALGERLMQTHLTAHLRQSQGWQPLMARFGGPQGFDGLKVRLDPLGRPTELMVAEAKFGSARLGQTASGLQMSQGWVKPRLERMATQYRAILELNQSNRLVVARPPRELVGRVERLQVPMRDGKAAVFWRENNRAPWHFNGRPDQISEAVAQVQAIEQKLTTAARGQSPLQRWIYRVELTPQGYLYTIKDASRLEQLRFESKLPTLARVKVPLSQGRGAAVLRISRAELAEQIHRHVPGISRTQANQYADELVKNLDDLRALHQASPSLSRTILVNSAKAGLVGAGLDLTMGILADLSKEGEIDWTRRVKSALVTFSAVGAGTAIGQGMVAFLTRNPILAQFAEHSSQVLGLGASSIVTNTLGSAVGAGAASIFLAYGGYLMGLYDLEAANRMAIAGTAGAAASALFVGGAFAAAAAFGTAGTGAAIGTLSGAAFTNAALAWIGGGTLAAGGGGTALGATILTGGAFLVVLGVTGGVMYYFNSRDRREEETRMRLTIDWLKTSSHPIPASKLIR